jgi:hypothetical protein
MSLNYLAEQFNINEILLELQSRYAKKMEVFEIIMRNLEMVNLENYKYHYHCKSEQFGLNDTIEFYSTIDVILNDTQLDYCPNNQF